MWLQNYSNPHNIYLNYDNCICSPGVSDFSFSGTKKGKKANVQDFVRFYLHTMYNEIKGNDFYKYDIFEFDMNLSKECFIIFFYQIVAIKVDRNFIERLH